MGLDLGIERDFVRPVTFAPGLEGRMSIRSNDRIWEEGT